MKKDYYVYEHIDTSGSIFYVGSGRSNRCFDTSGRNQDWWNKAYNNNTFHFSIKKIHTGLTKEESFQKEDDKIMEYGLNNLTNRKYSVNHQVWRFGPGYDWNKHQKKAALNKIDIENVIKEMGIKNPTQNAIAKYINRPQSAVHRALKR